MTRVVNDGEALEMELNMNKLPKSATLKFNQATLLLKKVWVPGAGEGRYRTAKYHHSNYIDFWKRLQRTTSQLIKRTGLRKENSYISTHRLSFKTLNFVLNGRFDWGLALFLHVFAWINWALAKKMRNHKTGGLKTWEFFLSFQLTPSFHKWTLIQKVNNLHWDLDFCKEGLALECQLFRFKVSSTVSPCRYL